MDECRTWLPVGLQTSGQVRERHVGGQTPRTCFDVEDPMLWQKHRRSIRVQTDFAVARDLGCQRAGVLAGQYRRRATHCQVDTCQLIRRRQRPQQRLGPDRLGRRWRQPGTHMGAAQLLSPTRTEYRERPSRQQYRRREASLDRDTIVGPLVDQRLCPHAQCRGNGTLTRQSRRPGRSRKLD